MPDPETLHQRWDAIAHSYDGLYTGAWSHEEDRRLKDFLGSRISVADRVLDVGCGTGLGATLLSESVEEVVGIDSSAAMLRQAAAKGLPLLALGDASALPFSTSSFSHTILLNGVLSYPPNLPACISELARVTRPGGMVVLSALGRWSPRRLLKLKFGSTERFSTRGSSLKGQITTYSVKELQQRAMEAGLRPFVTWSPSLLAGILELPGLASFDLPLSRLLPRMGHQVYIACRKQP